MLLSHFFYAANLSWACKEFFHLNIIKMSQHFNFEKKIVYIDMDGVLADFEKSVRGVCAEWDLLTIEERNNMTDDICSSIPGFFRNLEPIDGAIEAVQRISCFYDTYFLSAAMWNVPESYTDKRIWIGKHFGSEFRKRLILTHRKDLNIGHFLIDDRTSHGVDKFNGVHIHFGSQMFPDWLSVENHLMSLDIKLPKDISFDDIKKI
jgi:5'-nucleotidase